MDGTGDTVEGAEEKRLRFARDLIILTRRQGDETTEQQGALENAPLTNPECQWVHDTDVQNKWVATSRGIVSILQLTLPSSAELVYPLQSYIICLQL